MKKLLLLIFSVSMASIHAMQEADRNVARAYFNELKGLKIQFKTLSEKSDPTCDEFNNLETLADSIHIKYVDYAVKDSIQHLKASIDRDWLTIIRTLILAHQQTQATTAVEDQQLCLSDLDPRTRLSSGPLPANRYIAQTCAKKTAFFPN